ncbi:hypothetical protein BB560_001655 [Smittium megazygosporum]|uniref:Uncharacterized protein n=1 Tax=Smittium megazygosporum TaxID=133381 RepID=A0A2T9ZGZ7_9FUNG|nr:hypothetical protein BB560_001655 [Smittium megazygosporum]
MNRVCVCLYSGIFQNSYPATYRCSNFLYSNLQIKLNGSLLQHQKNQYCSNIRKRNNNFNFSLKYNRLGDNSARSHDFQLQLKKGFSTLNSAEEVPIEDFLKDLEDEVSNPDFCDRKRFKNPNTIEFNKKKKSIVNFLDDAVKYELEHGKKNLKLKTFFKEKDAIDKEISLLLSKLAVLNEKKSALEEKIKRETIELLQKRKYKNLRNHKLLNSTRCILNPPSTRSKLWWEGVDHNLLLLENIRRENVNIKREKAGKKPLPILKNPFNKKSVLSSYHMHLKSEIPKTKKASMQERLKEAARKWQLLTDEQKRKYIITSKE